MRRMTNCIDWNGTPKTPKKPQRVKTKRNPRASIIRRFLKEIKALRAKYPPHCVTEACSFNEGILMGEYEDRHGISFDTLCNALDRYDASLA